MADDRNTPEAEDVTETPQMLTDAQERLAASERQLEDTVALLKQTQADFENYQKRAARDRDTERKYAVAPLARDLFPALDNLQRAMDAARRALPSTTACGRTSRSPLSHACSTRAVRPRLASAWIGCSKRPKTSPFRCSGPVRKCAS